MPGRVNDAQLDGVADPHHIAVAQNWTKQVISGFESKLDDECKKSAAKIFSEYESVVGFSPEGARAGERTKQGAVRVTSC